MLIVILLLLLIGILFIRQGKIHTSDQRSYKRTRRIGVSLIMMTVFLLVIQSLMLFEQAQHGVGH